jgi:hypothetical protein
LPPLEDFLRRPHRQASVAAVAAYACHRRLQELRATHGHCGKVANGMAPWHRQVRHGPCCGPAGRAAPAHRQGPQAHGLRRRPCLRPIGQR